MSIIIVSMFLAILFSLFIAKVLDWTYIFQTKEYRIDRLLLYFMEEGIWRVLYGRLPRLPAKTPRNFLIVALSLGNLAIILPYIFSVFLVFFIPPVTFATTIVAMLITEILAQIKRYSIILQASQKIKESKAKFIGITGSYGKTATKEFLYQILSSKFKTARTDENMNTDVGIALSILKNLKPDTQYFVAEVGAYRRGEIARACRLIRPRYAILTAIGNQHLALFGTHDDLVKAKSELLESLPRNGVALVNQDIKEFNQIRKSTKARVIPFSMRGKAFVTDPSAAALLAGQLGMSPREIKTAISKIRPLKDRLSHHMGPSGSALISDSVNSNVDGFILAIKTLNRIKKTKKIIISKGIIELGEEKEPSYKRIARALNTTDIDLYTTDRQFVDSGTINVTLFANEDKILQKLRRVMDKRTAVLVEGKFTKNFIDKIKV